MKVTTGPAGRFGWEGQTLEYTVKVDGATDLAAPEAKKGLEVTVADVRTTATGIEATVDVAVTGPEFY